MLLINASVLSVLECFFFSYQFKGSGYSFNLEIGFYCFSSDLGGAEMAQW